MPISQATLTPSCSAHTISAIMLGRLISPHSYRLSVDELQPIRSASCQRLKPRNARAALSRYPMPITSCTKPPHATFYHGKWHYATPMQHSLHQGPSKKNGHHSAPARARQAGAGMLGFAYAGGFGIPERVQAPASVCLCRLCAGASAPAPVPLRPLL